MTLVPQTKRCEYWNHFIERWALENLGGDLRLTAAQLRHVKPTILEDEIFWTTVIFHHQGHHHTPEELAHDDQPNYTRCRETFWRLLVAALFRDDLLA